jgi:hypothetical protein
MPSHRLFSVLCVLSGALAVPALGAQGMDHSKMQGMEQGAAAPQSGQAAFAAISDVVKKLKADSTTDWSKVNIEALRQHLIDMDDVVMRASAKATNVDGGVSLDITGEGKVAAAIQRMAGMHAMALNMEDEYAAKSSEIPGGVRLVVTAKNTGDLKVVARIRGLGFAGLLAEGDHHAMHHMMLAKGEAMMHEHKP